MLFNEPYILSTIDPDDVETVHGGFKEKDDAVSELERLSQNSPEGTSLAITHKSNLVSTMFVQGEAQ